MIFFFSFWGEILQILALNRQLTSEIEAKDEELKDHVEGGSTLTRKSLKTPKFDLETSCKKAMAAQGTMPTSSNFLFSVLDP